MGMFPRWLKADTAYAQTQRTVDRQFFFKPDPAIRNIIGAAAARAQRTHPIIIYWLEFNRVRLFQNEDFRSSFDRLQYGIVGVLRQVVPLEFLGSVEFPVGVEVAARA